MWSQPVSGTFLFITPTQINISKPIINIAAFDLDWTLIRPIKGKFSKTPDDWALLPNVLNTLKAYKEAGYIIVIFTNQYSSNQTKLLFNYEKVSLVTNKLLENNVIDIVLMATHKDEYRKPQIGMWTLVQQVFKNYEINKTQSFYCGDAAGRPQDFADSDLQFANNIGIKFYTPEQIFPNNKITIPQNQSLFIFVGMPGSGKTTYYKNNLESQGFIHINQDTLKTKAKVLKAIDQALSSGKSVAVDATNPTSSKRAEYLKIASKYSVPSLILYFVGNGQAFNKLRDKPVPNIAYSVYYKNLEEPSLQLDGVNVVQLI